MRRAVIIFEGGPTPQTSLDVAIVGLRHAVTLDSLQKYLSFGVEQVVLATNSPALAHQASTMGASICDTAGEEPFHFGRMLQHVVQQIAADAVLYCSGAALPLISQHEIAWIFDALQQDVPRVVVNNLQSVDLVAWRPAGYALRIAPPESDNILGLLLREAGMERLLIPNSAGVHFDLDTPTDYLILGMSGLGGPRSAPALAALGWPTERLRQAADVLATDLPEVALIGRVGTPIIDHINRHLRVRLRIYSEERGMKALGREAQGSVVSLVAHLLDELGPQRFFDMLESVCAAAFFDTRVIFAHRGRRVTEWDRYHSDLGQVEQIRDPWVRTFTEAALRCRIPVVMGGHSVVSGGLWVLADRAIARLTGASGGLSAVFS